MLKMCFMPFRALTTKRIALTSHMTRQVLSRPQEQLPPEPKSGRARERESVVFFSYALDSYFRGLRAEHTQTMVENFRNLKDDDDDDDDDDGDMTMTMTKTRRQGQ